MEFLMSVHSAHSFFSPLARPHGAVWSPRLQAWLARTVRAMWRELEAIGQARANRELQRMSQVHAHNPELALALLRAMRPTSQRG